MVQNMTMPLAVAQTDGIIAQGGTILGSSRTNPYRNPETELALCAKVLPAWSSRRWS